MEKDRMYEDCVTYAIENGEITYTGLQRRFKLGYNRAQRIIEQMLHYGVIVKRNPDKPTCQLMDVVKFPNVMA